MKKIIYKIIILSLFLLPLLTNAKIKEINTLNVLPINNNSVQLKGELTTIYNNNSTEPVDVMFRYAENYGNTPVGSSTCPYLNNSTQNVRIAKSRNKAPSVIPFSATITGLKTGTNYYYCAVGTDTVPPYTVVYGEVKTFEISTSGGIITKTGTAKPDLIGKVTTNPIVNVTDIEAKLSGSVNRVDTTAYAYFRYSTAKKPPIFCNDIYGSNMISVNATEPNKLGKIFGAGNFYGYAYNLKPNTEYYYCAVVSNNAKNPTEIEYGEVQKFRTKVCPTCDQTEVITDITSSIGYDSARLRGSYFSNEKIETYFEYKENEIISILTPFLGTSKNTWVETSRKDHRAYTYGNFNEAIENLKPNTSYSYRAVGETSNPYQLYYGNILTFTTHSDPSDHGYLIEDSEFNPTGTGTEVEIPDQEPCIPSPYKSCPIEVEIPDTCFNGVQDGNETGIDTGGKCIDRDNDGVPDKYDDNYDWDGDGSDHDNGDGLNNRDNDGVPDKYDDNDNYDWDRDGFDHDNGNRNGLNDRDNDGVPDKYDDNDNYDWDRDGFDHDNGNRNGLNDRDNDGVPDKYDDNDNYDWDRDGFDHDNGRNNKNIIKQIGQIGNPPPDAIVRYHEGIEHVIYRQIKVNRNLRNNYSAFENTNDDIYYWNLSHQMAIDFAYVDRATGREIRVSQPDVSAYELQQVGNKLYVYEYHLESGVWRIIDVRETTTIFKNKNPFEYYFRKIKKFFGF